MKFIRRHHVPIALGAAGVSCGLWMLIFGRPESLMLPAAFAPAAYIVARFASKRSPNAD